MATADTGVRLRLHVRMVPCGSSTRDSSTTSLMGERGGFGIVKPFGLSGLQDVALDTIDLSHGLACCRGDARSASCFP